MLQDWEDGPKAGGRRKKKALKYRAQTRPREPLQGRWMFWAERGSDGRRLCQILNSYLQNKSPFSKAESDCQLRRLPASRSQSVSALTSPVPHLVLTGRPAQLRAKRGVLMPAAFTRRKGGGCKKNSLIERPTSAAGQLDQCLGPDFCSWMEMMSCLLEKEPIGGVKFIRTFQKASEDQTVNLPPNLGQLVHSVNYKQSEDSQVWRYFYDLRASSVHPFRGGEFQWAPYRSSRTLPTPMELIYIQSLNEAGLVMESGTTVTFDIAIGDVIFFPVGTQHYLRSVCDEELLLVVAYSTGKEELKTLRMNKYFMDTADHILAQLFHKDQKEFQNFPRA